MERSDQSNLPLPTEESRTYDADTTSTWLMRGNQEVRREVDERPSASRSVLLGVGSKRGRDEPVLADNPATHPFTATYEIEGTPSKKLRHDQNGDSAGYTKKYKGVNYHWRFDSNEHKLQLFPGNEPLPKDDPQSYFQYLPEPNSSTWRLVNDHYTVALNIDDLRSLKLVFVDEESDDLTSVHRIPIPGDKCVFYYYYKNNFYVISPDFQNETLVVEHVNGQTLEHEELYQWTKVPKP